MITSVMTELDIINTHVHDGGAALSASRCSNNNNDDDDDDAVKKISLKTFSIKGENVFMNKKQLQFGSPLHKENIF